MFGELMYKQDEDHEARTQALLAHDMFDNAPHGMFRTTRTGQYINANMALARLYGYESPAAMYSVITTIDSHLYVEQNRRNAFICLMSENGHVADFESQVKHANGSIIWISEVAREVRNALDRFCTTKGSS